MAHTSLAAFEKRTTRMIGGRHAGRSGGPLGAVPAAPARLAAALRCKCSILPMTAGSSMLAMILTCPPPCSQLWDFDAGGAPESLRPAH